MSYYSKVPKTLTENLKFRREILAKARNGKTFRLGLMEICSRDFLFWLNVFGWLHEPRDVQFPVKPFITYPFQDKLADEIFKAGTNKQHTRILKSRTMGVSWLMLSVVEWCWLFWPHTSYLLGSRNEDYVDNKLDDKSLFYKLDFLLERLPSWMLPSTNRTHMQMPNLSNGSVISGESTTGHFGRGARKTFVVIDEFNSHDNGYAANQAIQQASDWVLYNGTQSLPGTAFYDLKNKIPTLTCHWTEHPIYKKGLYRKDDDGQLEILDKDYIYPPDYKFILDKWTRSPWYDKQLKEYVHERLGHLELDMEVSFGSEKFFHVDMEKLYALTKEPYEMYDIEFSGDSENMFISKMIAKQLAPLALWTSLIGEIKPVIGNNIVFGVDVSNGTGNTNSVASIVDKDKGEKIGEYVTHRLLPEKFADAVVTLAKLFNNAFLKWEENGPGQIFGRRVKQLGYGRVFYRDKSDKPGWFPTKGSKETLLAEYRRLLDSGDFYNPSRNSLLECEGFYLDENNNLDYSSVISIDPMTGVRTNHGDRAMADALAASEIKSKKYNVDGNKMKTGTVGTVEYYRKLIHADAVKEALAAEYWD